jgi:hypothetical protein
MKKLSVVVVAVVALFALAAVSLAANSYTSTAKFTPNKAGKAKKPVPVGISLGFNVTETEGKRPQAMESLKIKLPGIVTNGKRFKKCSAAFIEQNQSDAKCPKGSLLASGYAKNIAGNRSDHNDTSLRCYLTIRLHNSGTNKLSLFVSGDNSNPGTEEWCPVEPQTAIPINITRSAGTSTMNLDIPENLKHPVSTLTNGIVEMRLNGKKMTKKVGKGKKRRKVGMFEAIGKCQGKFRNVTYTWTNEDGSTPSHTARAACKK